MMPTASVRAPRGRTSRSGPRGSASPGPGGGDIDMFSTNDPEWGILSTPVIDPTKSIVYVVAWHDDGGAQNYRYRLHALRLKDGTPPRPAGRARGARAQLRSARSSAPGLLLTGGVLYIAFGGDGNRGLAARLRRRDPDPESRVGVDAHRQ